MNRPLDYKSPEFESELQARWRADGVDDAIQNLDAENRYVLDMFPYPSGNGLHVGHLHGYIATDVLTRMYRAQGYNVLHPMGWDAFGLPAENTAIAQNIHPSSLVERNVANFKEQIQKVGLSYDWDRELSTTDPEFIRWTQDTFLDMYEAGLVEEVEAPINWCGSCETGLANEDVEQGCCERCNTEVEKRPMRQWSIKITEYADRLLDDMDQLPQWDESLLNSQREWIGKKEGLAVTLSLQNQNGEVLPFESFVSEPKKIEGASFIMMSPEAAEKILERFEHGVSASDEEFITQSKLKKVSERKGKAYKMAAFKAINPLNGNELPLFINDGLSSTDMSGVVIGNTTVSDADRSFVLRNNILLHDDETAIEESVDPAQQLFDGGFAHEATIYRLEDWVFSRQRYWGEPIPIIHCQNDCGAVPVPRDELPVLLPEVDSYQPSGTGESPLATITDWVNTECPCCGGDGKRETNTMPQWAGSSWYFERFKDPHNQDALVGPEADQRWPQVDVYIGGAEHATRHLIYARFWQKVLYDSGVVVSPEPFKRVEKVGLVLGPDGRKMSKRWGNVVNPDTVIEEHGADVLRIYEMFIGEFSQPKEWNEDGIKGVRRFLDRVISLFPTETDERYLESQAALDAAIEKVTNDIDKLKFNTAVAALMELSRTFSKHGVNLEQYKKFLQLLQPFAPHVTEALWEKTGGEYPIALQQWPTPNTQEGYSEDVTSEMVIMINGKKVGVMAVAASCTVEELTQRAAATNSRVSEAIESEMVKRIINPSNKGIINFVTK